MIAEDLAETGAAQRVFEAVGAITPDLLINNAGFGMLGPFADEDLNTHLQMIQVNVTSLVTLTASFFPGMRNRGSGGSSISLPPRPFNRVR